MRLTLRTLLAYLDDILEPADARQLGQKIEESEFASGLVHRIRSVTRKLRLGAPKLSGKGMGLDANTVAEYLDNTLPQDRVPDFERVCLESDVHLAEVASCHQILTLVLGEPADVDPVLRERIRALQPRGDEPGRENRPPATEPAAATQHSAPRVDYLPSAFPQQACDDPPELPRVDIDSTRDIAPRPGIRVWPIAATLVVTFLLALAALVAMGPLDANHPILGRLLTRGSRDGGQEQPVGESSSLPAIPTALPSPDAAAPGGSEEATLPAAESSGKSPERVVSPTEPEPASERPLPGSVPAETAAAAVPEGGDRKPADAPTAPDAAVATRDAMPPPKPPAENAASADVNVDVGKTAPDAAGDAKPVAGEPEKEPEPLARCNSSLHVLARSEPTRGTWLRLAANDPVAPQQELVALPTYRPQVVFAAGIQLLLVGPAAVSLRASEAEGTPGIVAQHGRFVVTTDGSPPAALMLQIGDRVSRVTFSDPGAALALEVRRYHPPGTDPEVVAAHRLIRVVSVAGNLVWQDVDVADAVTLEAGQEFLLIDARPGPPPAASSPPDWLEAKDLRPIDRDASRQLEPLLEVNRPLVTSLLEQASHRLVEVRSLAIRSLGLLGNYDPFVDAFNHRTHRNYWLEMVDALAATLTYDEAAATHVRTTLERLRGEDGGRLYRMLWGFSQQQLDDGAAAQLVEALSSPAMDLRVFAYLNLYRIVGKTNTYQPELDPERQRRAVLNWERDLKGGKIIYRTPPFEVPK